MPRSSGHALFATVLLFAACAPAATPSTAPSPSSSDAGLPRRLRVHVDHVARTRTADFESARREMLAAFTSKGVSEGTTFVLETDEPTYLSLRPFERYADLDDQGAKQKLAYDAVGEATVARLDGVTHGTLVPPHKNEMWSLQSALTYTPPGGATLATAKVGRMVQSEVMPDKDDAYGEAVTREVHALAEAQYPVTRAVYVSAYGSGRYVTLWLAMSQEDLTTKLGRDAWSEEARARAASSDESEHSILMRHDLESR